MFSKITFIAKNFFEVLILPSFAERFKQLRLEKNITQVELGKIFNIKHSSISKYENNTAIPEISLLINFADYFNVSVDYLLARNNIKIITEGFNDKEAELIRKYRELDERDHNEILELINVKYDRVLKIKNASISTNGEEAATSETA